MQFLSKTISKKFINKEILSVGFDESYAKYAKNKHIFLSIKIFDVTSKQANIIKQTALSSGCDCAVHRGVVDCSIEISDCILSGTLAQLETVAKKLYSQPFSLSNLANNILEQIEIENSIKKRTKVMGILNLTPNSFSDGGEFVEIDKAINHAVDMIEQGANIIDIGAQSTRPGADVVDCDYEINKVIPILSALKAAYPNIEISVDTFNFECAKSALEAGADIINDVSFLSDSEFVNLVNKYDKKLVIMHSKGNPKTMDNLCKYDNIVDDIYKELAQKAQHALSFGLEKKNVIIDLGFGFAKNVEQNFTLLNRINEFRSLGYPILAGVSRKRFLQDVINTKEPKDADIQTLLASSWFIQQEIEYIRVHNVELTMQALKFNDRLYTFN